jgi:trk system potassium uptake protein TrkA
MKRFVVIGLGNFGSSVAEALHARGHEVIAIDSSDEAVDRIAPHVTRAAAGDARSLATLGCIAPATLMGVVSTGDDITASILATLALGDRRARGLRQGDLARSRAGDDASGVTETVFPSARAPSDRGHGCRVRRC